MVLYLRKRVKGLSWFIFQFSSVAQLCPTLQPHELHHDRPPCPSPTSGVHSNSRPSSWWCHPTVSSSVTPLLQFSSVQLLSRVWLCDPMNRSTPGLPVHHQLPEFTQTHVHPVGDAIQPSHPLWWGGLNLTLKIAKILTNMLWLCEY